MAYSETQIKNEIVLENNGQIYLIPEQIQSTLSNVCHSVLDENMMVMSSLEKEKQY